MAVIPVVTCPECEKKFRPKAELTGKKIKCPFCTEAFVPDAGKEMKQPKAAKNGQDAKAKPAKPKAEPAKKPVPVVEAAPEEKKPADENFDADPDPYGVNKEDLVQRCPHCAKEMKGANAIICIYCGYNTLTRQAGSTEKTLGLTFQQQFKYLAPALGSAVFTLGSVIFLLYYAIVSPFDVDNTMFSFTDHESLRMWTTVIFLGWIWGAGIFCFKKFIEKPKPDEIKIE